MCTTKRPPSIGVAALAHELAHDGAVHRDLREHRDVACARHVARRVEPVRPHEVRVAQAELFARVRSSTDEARDVAARRRRRERVGGVVRALDQRALEQVAHA